VIRAELILESDLAHRILATHEGKGSLGNTQFHLAFKFPA
jgi:hypothetical protein